jgi:AP-5 complex subunit zeta-1
MTSQVYRCLRSIVLEPEQGPVKIRLVAAAILRELSPLQKILIRDFSPPIDPQNIPYILPVVIAQSNVKEQSVILITHLTKWLTHPGIEENLCISSLSALSTLLSHSSFIESFTEEQLDLLNSKFSHWLKHASKNSLSQSSSGISLFTGASRKQVVPIQEIDGSTAQDIFTILSIGDQYFCDQLLNIRMFSMLRRWIGSTKALGCSAPSPHDTPTPTPDSSHTSSSDHRSLTVSMISNATPTSLTSASPSSFVQSYRPEVVGGAMGVAIGGIVNTALQYCLRVINQCERKPLKNNNDELIKACLYEAVTLLDIICGSKHRAIHEVFSTVKSLFSRILHDENYSRVSLAVVKFFINHGKSEMYSYEPGIHALFGDVLSNKFNDPGIAFDAVEFCLSNLEQLCYSTSIFTKYFPNLLKILAWSPPTYISEYLQLLPAFINEQTASEVLHSILDLPCLSAVLTANYLVANVQPSVLQNMLPQYLECLTALQDQSNKLLFGHFLRNESGRGDTIDKLKYLHEILEDFNKHQRIINASEIVPLLLKIYFKIVINFGNKELLSELINVLLERVLCLYNETTFQEEVRQYIT